MVYFYTAWPPFTTHGQPIALLDLWISRHLISPFFHKHFGKNTLHLYIRSGIIEMMPDWSGIIAAAGAAPIVARFDLSLLRILSPFAHNCLAISFTCLYLVGTDALSQMLRTS